MSKDACKIIRDLFIQLDRVTRHFPLDSEYRHSKIQQFLRLGYILGTKTANAKEWQDAYREALDLWNGIVNELPYAGYSADDI